MEELKDSRIERGKLDEMADIVFSAYRGYMQLRRLARS